VIGSVRKTSRRAADLAAVERGLEVLVDDQRAASDVEDAHAIAHLRQRLGVDHAVGIVGRRHVQREEVSLRVDLIGRVRLLDLQRLVELGRDERVVGDDAHAERLRAVRDELPDAAEAEDPERLVHELDAAEVLAVPASGAQRAVRLRDVARERQQQRHRVLGRRDDVRARRVDDDDAAFRGRRDVDVVDPDAGARDGA